MTPLKNREEEEAKVSEDKNKDIVEVSKKDLKDFLARLDTLESENKKLLKVADVSRLHNLSEKERASKALIRVVALSRLGEDGPFIIAWKMTKNESRVDGNRMIEDQRMEVFFEDGKSKELSLKDFYRNVSKKTKAEIVKRATDEKSGKEILTVEMKDGKRLDISIEYVN